MASDNNHSFIDYSELSPAEVEREMKHERMCAELNDIVGNFLATTYKNYPWAVNANIQQGIVNFWLGIGHGGRSPYGVTVKIDSSIQPMLMQVKKYGGELLERYGLNRGQMIEKEMQDLISKADFAGRIKADES